MQGKQEKRAGRGNSEEESPAGSRKQIKSFRRGIAFRRMWECVKYAFALRKGFGNSWHSGL